MFTVNFLPISLLSIFPFTTHNEPLHPGLGSKEEKGQSPQPLALGPSPLPLLRHKNIPPLFPSLNQVSQSRCLSNHPLSITLHNHNLHFSPRLLPDFSSSALFLSCLPLFRPSVTPETSHRRNLMRGTFFNLLFILSSFPFSNHILFFLRPLIITHRTQNALKAKGPVILVQNDRFSKFPARIFFLMVLHDLLIKQLP